MKPYNHIKTKFAHVKSLFTDASDIYRVTEAGTDKTPITSLLWKHRQSFVKPKSVIQTKLINITDNSTIISDIIGQNEFI